MLLKLVLFVCLAGLMMPGITQDEAPLNTTITTDNTAVNDEQIATRLQAIYNNFKDLDSVTIEVEDGVVTLGGNVLQRSAIEQAENLASRTQNVVSVVNEIEFNQDVQQKLGFVFEDLTERTIDIVQFLPVLLVALLVFIGFFFLARRLTRERTYFQRFTPNAFIADLLRQALRILITLLGLIIALEIADATSILGSVLGALGLVGLAIGFAIRDTVENYIASILLSLRQPFSPNDHVRIDDKEGLVQRLTARATILMDFDGNHIRIPNSTVFKGIITNFSRNPNRRFSFDVGVGVDVDLADALETARSTLADIPGVLTDPGPLTSIQSLGDSNVVIRCYAWLNQKQSSYLLVRSEAIRLIKTRFEAADFDMPEPIYRLHIRDMSQTQLLSTTDADDTQKTKQTQPPTLRVSSSTEPMLPAAESPDQVIQQQSANESNHDNLLSHDAPVE